MGKSSGGPKSQSAVTRLPVVAAQNPELETSATLLATRRYSDIYRFIYLYMYPAVCIF